MHSIKPDIMPEGTHPSLVIDRMGEAMLAIESAAEAAGQACPRAEDYADRARFSEDHREHWRRIGILVDLAEQYRAEARSTSVTYDQWRSATAVAG